MKQLLTIGMALALAFPSFAQENEESNADNFSLEGALELFKKSTSVEDFEQKINEENNSVNNLDLNSDSQTDYITVTDIGEGNLRILVLSTFLAEEDKQDIAVISIEKTGNEEAQIEIVGDEDLFGADAIAEPNDMAENIKGGKGPDWGEYTATRVVVNVWLWPSVRFVYAPNYVVWRSPWRWRHYPVWWRPWRPVTVTVFRTRCAPHAVYYHRTNTRRIVAVNRIYTPQRRSSTVVVKNRRGTTVVHKNKRGNVKAVKVKRTPSRRR